MEGGWCQGWTDSLLLKLQTLILELIIKEFININQDIILESLMKIYVHFGFAAPLHAFLLVPTQDVILSNHKWSSLIVISHDCTATDQQIMLINQLCRSYQWFCYPSNLLSFCLRKFKFCHRCLMSSFYNFQKYIWKKQVTYVNCYLGLFLDI